MATVLEILTAATRKARITPLGEAMDAETGAEALGEYNRMLHAWKLSGVDIIHDDQEQSDEFPLGPEYQEGTVYLLAKRLEPNYRVPADFDADAFWRAIQANQMTIEDVSYEKALTSMPSASLVGR